VAEKTLVGEAAIRIVPSLRGFKPEADRRLKEMRFEPIRVRIDPAFAEADAQMDEWRARQQLNAVNVPVKADFQSFQRDLSQVEHIFKRSSLSKAIRLNIKVIGLDALPALAYAAGSAASALDALGKASFALPGILGGVGASVGALLIGMRGLKDVFQAYSQDSKNATQDARKQQDANRALERSYRDYRSAVRDTIREIQDLNHENRLSSLNAADALLDIQESADALKKGGFTSFSEAQRAQLNYLRSIDHYQQTMVRAQRTAEDTADANARGIAGADKVIDALDQIAQNTAKLNESQISEVDKALEKLAPNAQATVQAIRGLSGEWTHLTQSVQNNLFAGLDKEITDLGQKALPGLEVGLSRVASGLNANFRSVAETLGNAKSGSFLERIFGNTDVALERFSRAVNPLITGILRLTADSGNFLPRLADGADKVFSRFDRFTERIEADGSLDKWISNGITALDHLGNSVINIASIVSSVSKAFDEAAGHSGGFTKNLEDVTQKLADLLKSGKGQSSLVDYFRQAHQFISQISSSIRDMRPFLREVADTAREWSAGLFAVIGGLSQAASWIDRNTGLLKVLVDTYLVVRTVRPIVEGLTGAWKNYATVVQAAAKFDIPGLRNASQNIDVFRGKIDKFTVAGQKAAREFPALQQVASGVTPPLNKLAGAAENAASKVGGTGTSLLGRVGALGAALGPGAALAIGIPLAMAALDQLGDAHHRAAQEASAQADALGRLKTAVDSVTGAVTTEGLTQTLQTAQKFPVQGFGDRNLISDFVGSGLGDSQEFTRDLLPTNQRGSDEAIGRADQMVQRQVEQGEAWRRYGTDLSQAGIDSLTLAKALRGDPDSLAKFRAFRERQKGARGGQDLPSWVPGADQINQANERTAELGGLLVPDLQEIRTALPGGAQASIAGQGLAQLRGSLVDSGALAQQANQAQNGHGKFKSPDVAAFWARLGASNDNTHISLDNAGNAVITTDVDPHLDPAVGSTTKIGSGYQTTLSVDATEAQIQKFADGGMVRGNGGPREDNILTATSVGEHITNADAVKYYGVGLFDSLNNQRVPRAATGAWFGAPPPLAPPTPAPPPPPRPAPPPTTITGPWTNLLPIPNAPAPQLPKPALPNVSGTATIPDAVIPGQKSTGEQMWDGLSKAGTWFNDNLAHHDPTFKLNSDRPQVPNWMHSDAPPSPPPAAGVPFNPLERLGLKPLPPPPPPAPPAPQHLTGTSAPGPQHHLNSTPAPTSTPGASRALPGPPRSAPRGLPAGAPPAYIPAPAGIQGIPAGTPLPVGAGSEDRLQINTIRTKRSISAAFPQISDIGGFREDPGHPDEHPAGKAIDVMLPSYNTPEGRALGEQVKAYVLSHAQDFGVDYVLYNQTQWNADGSSSGMEDRGSDNENHRNHLHVHTNGGGYPSGAEQYLSPLGGVASDLPPIPGLPPGLLPGGGQHLPVGSGAFPWMNQDPMTVLKNMPKNIQPGNILSQVGQILLQGVAGAFGIDTSYLGDFSQVANFFLGKFGGAAGAGGATGLNADAAQGMQDYINQQGGISPQLQQMLQSQGLSIPGLTTTSNTNYGNNGPLDLGGGPGGSIGYGVGGTGLSGPSFGGQGGSAAVADGSVDAKWGTLISQVCSAMGVDPGKWKGPLEAQIQSESGGDQFSINDHDSDGKGGIQTVKGLFNFLPSTFDQYKVKGFGSGDINDPVSQIAAAINYTKARYGTAPDGAPLHIGHGTGFQAGGYPGGPAYISAGEFRTNPAATAHYGSALFDALNAKQIPRSTANKFARGGWPGGIPRYDGGSPPPLIPLPTPMLAPPSQSNGPLPSGSAPPGQPGGGAPMPSAGQPIAAPPPSPDAGLGNAGQSNLPGVQMPQFAPGPGTGGLPGSGATAPAPDPGSLPGVSDALSAIGGMGSSIGGGGGGAMPQPGAQGTNDGDDQRATLGASPTSNDHNLPALSQGIQGAASTIGGWAAMAAQAAIEAGAAGGSFGAGAPAGAAAGSAAAQGIQAGAQMIGQVATGAVNILSSLAVGSLSNGSTQSASGIPLLPQRAPVQNGVAPVMQQRIHNGDINVTNLDEFKRTQNRMDAQDSMPFIGKY
jgi:hypothetical protein